MERTAEMETAPGGARASEKIISTSGLHKTYDTGEVRAVERTDGSFCVATLFQPQLRTQPGAPHPIWRGFVEAVAGGRPAGTRPG